MTRVHTYLWCQMDEVSHVGSGTWSAVAIEAGREGLEGDGEEMRGCDD